MIFRISGGNAKKVLKTSQLSSQLFTQDPANPVFQFMDKKRAEGKHFYVYTMAGAAKFLRIYYARVKARLKALDAAPFSAA